MKSLLFSSALFFISGTALFAQRTTGGSKKNYEMYHVIYDTIFEKVPVDIEKYKMRYISIGPNLVGGTSKSLPADFWSKWDSNGNWAYPFQTGEIGAKTGFNITFGSFNGLNFINKNLITDIEIGVETQFYYSNYRFDWSPLISTMPGSYLPDEKEIYTGILSNMKGTYHILGLGLGLGIVYHTPLDGLDAKFSLGILQSVAFNNLYTYSGTSTLSNGDVETITIDLDANDSYSYSLGESNAPTYLNLKLGLKYSSFYLGVSIAKSSQVINNVIVDHTFRVDSGINYVEGTWNRTFYTNYKLGYASIDFGFAF